jgi:nicotinamide mononucleotide transporter
MEARMLKYLSVDTVLLMIGSYPLSWIELVGTVLYFLSVWLIARRNMLTWPVGIASVILYGILFYQIQLYSDTIEQVYYLGVSIYGWIAWRRSRADAPTIRSGFSPVGPALLWATATLVLAFGAGQVVARFHLWLPVLFPVAASFPFLDALTTVMSFVAMFLMTRRRTESWIYWIVVDVIGIGLYWVKEVRFISIQYVVLLGMAVYGLVHWIRAERQSPPAAAASAARRGDGGGGTA